MPRTTTLETPGCPPIRALAFDVLGLIKVVEAKGEDKGAPKVVERWGAPDSSRAVVASSFLDREIDPLLGVARKNGSVDILSSVTGDIQVSITNSSPAAVSPDSNSIAGLYLFRTQSTESSSRSATFLTCTMKGNARMGTVELQESSSDTVTETTWNTSSSGDILFSKVDESECYGLFGGKGVEVNLWDLQSTIKLWTAKSPVKNSLGIFTPTWFTSASFLSKDEHRKFVTGTNNHQVRLYDTSAQRRPVLSFDFGETAIKAVSADLDGYTVYAGNGSGDLASFDMRTGKLLGRFLGKCAGSIRSVVRHPEYPIIASCGLDSYLRFWDIESRQLLSAVFLKQNLTDVVFDSYFKNKEVIGSTANLLTEPQGSLEISEATEEDPVRPKRKKMSKLDKESKKRKYGDLPPKSQDIDEDENEESIVPAEAVKQSKAHKGGKEPKSKSRKARKHSEFPPESKDSDDDQTESIVPAEAVKQSKAYKGGKEPKSKSRKARKHSEFPPESKDSDDDQTEESIVPAKRAKQPKAHKKGERSKSKKTKQ